MQRKQSEREQENRLGSTDGILKKGSHNKQLYSIGYWSNHHVWKLQGKTVSEAWYGGVRGNGHHDQE